MTSPVCFRCGCTPNQLPEYIEASADADLAPDTYVRTEEGTYNPVTNTFACTPCYCAIGMPSAPRPGWKAPAQCPTPTS